MEPFGIFSLLQISSESSEPELHLSGLCFLLLFGHRTTFKYPMIGTKIIVSRTRTRTKFRFELNLCASIRNHFKLIFEVEENIIRINKCVAYLLQWRLLNEKAMISLNPFWVFI